MKVSTPNLAMTVPIVRSEGLMYYIPTWWSLVVLASVCQCVRLTLQLQGTGNWPNK